MKRCAVLFTLVLSLGYAGEPEAVANLYDALQPVYDQVVKADGTVDYAALKDSDTLQKPLRDFVTFMADFDPQSIEDKSAKIALLTNTYNVFTMVGVVDAWPVESVRKIHFAFGFFTKNLWRINGKKVSLNDIENKMLRPLDVRVHFTINCASTSCPPLLPQVFNAANVNEKMDQATVAFLKDETKNQFDREKDEWRLSKIFDWYKEDWQDEAGLVAFIHKYRPDLEGWQPDDIDHLDYDWSLNGPTKRN